LWTEKDLRLLAPEVYLSKKLLLANILRWLQVCVIAKSRII